MSAEQRLLSVPELSHHLAESYLTCCLYLQEMLQYKRQNHGKVRNRYQSATPESNSTILTLIGRLNYVKHWPASLDFSN